MGKDSTEMAKQNIRAVPAVYDDISAYLDSVPKFTSKNTPDVTKRYLELLGAPDRTMKIIHVAGTNGKGSVCCYLASILMEAGYTAGAFISPHLVTVRERMTVNGRMIGKDDFVQAFLRVRSVYLQASEAEDLPHPSYFEFLFLMFMSWIQSLSEKPDYVILETGLGGRLDSTNTVARKEMTVITRIGLDHMEYLGNTIPEIASEKAGIIRKGVQVVCLEDPPEAFEVIRAKAAAEGAECIPVGRAACADAHYEPEEAPFHERSMYKRFVSESSVEEGPINECFINERSLKEHSANGCSVNEALLHGTSSDGGSLHKTSLYRKGGKKAEEAIAPGRFEGISVRLSLPSGAVIQTMLRTPALYQAENAALAASAIDLLRQQGLSVSDAQIENGLHNAVWPGRMEECLPGVFLDGGHNADGIRAFLETVREMQHSRYTGGENILLFSAVRDKQFHIMTDEIAASGLFDRVIAAPMKTTRTLTGKALADSLSGSFRTHGRNIPPLETYDSVREAFLSVMKIKKQNDRIYVAGSLYLVGEIKEILQETQAKGKSVR